MKVISRFVARRGDAPFPPLHTASADGLLAIGGDLSQARLVAAYRRGIFPWYTAGQPVLWWSPDPRCALLPGRFHASRSLRRTMRRGDFDFTVDAAFARVIAECAAPRRPGGDGAIDGDGDGVLSRHPRSPHLRHPRVLLSGGGDGDGEVDGDGDGDGDAAIDRDHTWLTADMVRAYTKLHHAGLAHSAEVWRGGELIGGVYGVAMGGVFFGESMFSRARDASKIALARLVDWLRAWGFALIDCQVSSPHLLRLGAEEFPREEFIARLEAALKLPGKPGSWAGAVGDGAGDGDGEGDGAGDGAGDGDASVRIRRRASPP